jgi:hypothetical protein
MMGSNRTCQLRKPIRPFLRVHFVHTNIGVQQAGELSIGSHGEVGRRARNFVRLRVLRPRHLLRLHQLIKLFAREMAQL